METSIAFFPKGSDFHLEAVERDDIHGVLTLVVTSTTTMASCPGVDNPRSAITVGTGGPSPICRGQSIALRFEWGCASGIVVRRVVGAAYFVNG